MEAPIFGVHAAVLQQAVDVVEEPANEVAARPGGLGFVEVGTEVEVTLRFWQDANLYT